MIMIHDFVKSSGVRETVEYWNHSADFVEPLMYVGVYAFVTIKYHTMPGSSHAIDQ